MWVVIMHGYGSTVVKEGTLEECREAHKEWANHHHYSYPNAPAVATFYRFNDKRIERL